MMLIRLRLYLAGQMRRFAWWRAYFDRPSEKIQDPDDPWITVGLEWCLRWQSFVIAWLPHRLYSFRGDLTDEEIDAVPHPMPKEWLYSDVTWYWRRRTLWVHRYQLPAELKRMRDVTVGEDGEP